jgi:hypothetical protein
MRLVAQCWGVALALGGSHIALRAQAPIRAGLRQDFVGCYALFTAMGTRVDSTFYNAGPLVHLDSTRDRDLASAGVPGMYRVAVRLDTSGRAMTAKHAHSIGAIWWADSLSDSIRLSFSNGFSGAFLTLVDPRPRSDTLRGWIEEHWDFGPPTTHGPASAVRIPCIR